MLGSLRKLFKDKTGASAVEMAFLAPIITFMLFGFFAIGSYMFGLHQAQRTIEKTARDIRYLDEPTQADIEATLQANLKNAVFGTYAPSVRIIQNSTGNYAAITITYNVDIKAPFLKTIQLNTPSTTQIPIREMPV